MSNFKFVISLLLILAFGATLVFVTATNTSKQQTLRDRLSQPTPMVSSMEVVGYHDGIYVLANVNGDQEDIGNYALTNEYQLGDIVQVLWATEDSTEIAGDIKVGTLEELDK